MPDKDVVIAKIASIQKCLKRIEEVTSLDPASLNNIDKQDIFILNLQRAVQACIDLAEKGMNILFIPFWTDTKNAYLRIRRCSQARAIENECYVAIGGSVGNIPKVENMDIQYSQAAVFTPSDFAFPHDAIAAEATPNTEMALIADLDVNLIKELRQTGSVRNLQSRRQDLYHIQWKKGLRGNEEE